MSRRAKHQLRIIAGTHRGRTFPVPAAPGLRPTGDRMRELLFNWLQFDVPGARVLDWFAGTGALGLEALSRGAAQVTFVEARPALAAVLDQRLAAWSLADRALVIAGDALDVELCGPFDLILLDPPFDAALWTPALARSATMLAADGQLAIEFDDRFDVGSLDAWSVIKSKRLGASNLALLKPRSPATATLNTTRAR